MSNPPASRPSSARKVTRKTEENRADELDQGVRVIFDGTTYEVRMGDLTAPIARELRRATGGSFQALMEQMESDPDIDTIATIVWLARRVKGERIDIDDVALGYGDVDDLDVQVAGREEVDPASPEA